MRWIHRGRQLGQAVKNVQRLRQILTVFAKHGFVDIVERMNLGRFLPARWTMLPDFEGELISTPVRLRLAFEELGPTFIKFGQLLSTRSDLLPENFIEEFVKLQDKVQPLPFETVRGTVEKELGRSLAEAFAEFDPRPLAAASIAQVHSATLHSAEGPGEKVVVKIQRPEIGKIIDTDVSILAFLAGLLEKYVPETRIIGPRTVVSEFFRTLSYELDFLVEANNMGKIAENMRDFDDIVIPRVYRQLSTHRVLTLERLDGIRVNDIKGMDVAGIDRKHVVEVGAKAFFRSVMIDGIFHGDLHGGNLFVLPGNKLGVVDFGIVGRLSQRSRDQLASMVMSLLGEDYENLCYEYAELGSAGAAIDFDGFQRDVRNALAPYMGLTISEVNLGKILIEATKIAVQYDIKVPGDWMIVFKAILTMEGMGRTLDPGFDLLKMGEELIRELVKNRYSKERVAKDLAWLGKDVVALLQTLPRQIRWMFRKLNSNDFAFEFRSRELDEIRIQLDKNARRSSQAILTAGFFIAGAITIQNENIESLSDFPLPAAILFLLGAIFLARYVGKSLR